jgi:SPW repeat
MNFASCRSSDPKELFMRFIPTRLHAPLDYVGAALIAAPWIFQFSEHTAATVIPIVLGIGLIAYSLFTDYELGVWRVFPMSVHNLYDIAAGALLAASPWIFGFADDTANVWAPHLVVGLAAIFLGLTTKQQAGYRDRKRGAERPSRAAAKRRSDISARRTTCPSRATHRVGVCMVKRAS